MTYDNLSHLPYDLLSLPPLAPIPRPDLRRPLPAHYLVPEVEVRVYLGSLAYLISSPYRDRMREVKVTPVQSGPQVGPEIGGRSSEWRWEIIPVRHGGCKRGKGPKVAKFLDKWTGEFCPRCLPWMKIDFTFPFLFSFILTIHLPIHYIHCWFILSFHHSYYRWNNIRTNMNDE